MTEETGEKGESESRQNPENLPQTGEKTSNQPEKQIYEVVRERGDFSAKEFCLICQEKIGSNHKNQWIHRWLHSEKLYYRCQLCQDKFEDFYDLNQHHKQHFAKLKQTLGTLPTAHASNAAAPATEAPTTARETLKTDHINNGEEDEGDSDNCLIIEWKDSEEEKDHNLLSDSGDFEDELFKAGTAIAAVSPWQRGVRSAVEPCNKCDMLFNNSQSLENHLKEAHDEKMYYPCMYCGKLFLHSDNLQRHINLCQRLGTVLPAPTKKGPGRKRDAFFPAQTPVNSNKYRQNVLEDNQMRDECRYLRFENPMKIPEQIPPEFPSFRIAPKRARLAQKTCSGPTSPGNNVPFPRRQGISPEFPSFPGTFKNPPTYTAFNGLSSPALRLREGNRLPTNYFNSFNNQEFGHCYENTAYVTPRMKDPTLAVLTRRQVLGRPGPLRSNCAVVTPTLIQNRRSTSTINCWTSPFNWNYPATENVQNFHSLLPRERIVMTHCPYPFCTGDCCQAGQSESKMTACQAPSSQSCPTSSGLPMGSWYLKPQMSWSGDTSKFPGNFSAVKQLDDQLLCPNGTLPYKSAQWCPPPYQSPSFPPSTSCLCRPFNENYVGDLHSEALENRLIFQTSNLPLTAHSFFPSATFNNSDRDSPNISRPSRDFQSLGTSLECGAGEGQWSEWTSNADVHHSTGHSNSSQTFSISSSSFVHPHCKSWRAGRAVFDPLERPASAADATFRPHPFQPTLSSSQEGILPGALRTVDDDSSCPSQPELPSRNNVPSWGSAKRSDESCVSNIAEKMQDGCGNHLHGDTKSACSPTPTRSPGSSVTVKLDVLDPERCDLPERSPSVTSEVEISLGCEQEERKVRLEGSEECLTGQIRVKEELGMKAEEEEGRRGCPLPRENLTFSQTSPKAPAYPCLTCHRLFSTELDAKLHEFCVHDDPPHSDSSNSILTGSDYPSTIEIQGDQDAKESGSSSAFTREEQEGCMPGIKNLGSN